MEVGGDAIEWDFLTLVTLWNLVRLASLFALRSWPLASCSDAT